LDKDTFCKEEGKDIDKEKVRMSIKNRKVKLTEASAIPFGEGIAKGLKG